MDDSFNLNKIISNYQTQHKLKPPEFTSVAKGVQKRLGSNQKHRQSSRYTLLDNIRNIHIVASPVLEKKTISKSDHRKEQLEIWKKQKEKQKKEAAVNKKKPFLVGLPHQPQKYVPPPPIAKSVPSRNGRVTRSQTAKMNSPVEVKRKEPIKSFAPKNATFKAPLMKNISILPTLAEKNTYIKPGLLHKTSITFNPIIAKEKNEVRSTRSQTTNTVKAETGSRRAQKAKEKVIQKSQMQRTARKLVPKSESVSEEKLRSPKEVEKLKIPEQEKIKTPEQKIVEEAVKNSPYVVMSRGKANATKEMKTRLTEALFGDEDNDNIKNVEHFRQQLAYEIQRLTNMCDTWSAMTDEIPENVQDVMLSAVGQGRLLMSKKFAQFASLVETCAEPKPDQPVVTLEDLQGFWDMMYMQVENVNTRFKQLEELKSRGWEEQQPEKIGKRVAKANVKKVTKPVAAPSRLREMIAAARKAKKEQETPAPVPEAEVDTKTFDAGFFSLRSPIRSPTAGSPSNRTPSNNSSLLKCVLSSEAQKSARKACSFAMLRASVMSKNMEYEGIAPIPQTPLPPVNMNATPGRSILKTPNTNQKPVNKSFKMVLFNEMADMNSSLLSENKGGEDNETSNNINDQILEMGHDKEDDKENSRRKSKVIKHETGGRSPVITRSKRSTIHDGTLLVKEVEDAITSRKSIDITPHRSNRRSRKSKTNDDVKVNINILLDVNSVKSSKKLTQESEKVLDETPGRRKSARIKKSPQNS